MLDTILNGTRAIPDFKVITIFIIIYSLVHLCTWDFQPILLFLEYSFGFRVNMPATYI